jgi:hypothetical protein
MVWPVKAGTRITAAFRQTSSTNWKTCGYHTGTDFGSFDGDPIYAVVAGNVWRRDYGPAFGITCAVSPDTPGEWQYSHLQSIDVPNGAWVEAGDRIATSGRSGGVDPHVHIEWHPNHKGEWRCGIQADPIAELNRLNATAPTTPTYPTPTSNKVYLSKLKYGQDDSDSVWYLQRALGMAKEYWTGFYGPLTDEAVRAHQTKHFPPADPAKASFVGPKQAALLFGSNSGITVVDDLPKDPDPSPPAPPTSPSWWKSAAGVQLFAQVDAIWPNRDRKTDGTIGDLAHCGPGAPPSEHCPDPTTGVVRAIDIDADLGAAGDSQRLADAIVNAGKKGDNRLWYVIHNGRIRSVTYGWVDKEYTGSNPHTSHIHVSFKPTGDKDGRPFDLSSLTEPLPPVTPVPDSDFQKLKEQVEKNTAAIAALRSSFMEFQKGQTTKNIEVSKLFENLSAVFLED